MKKLGSWCVVTGATDGIGKAYAFNMAKKGLNVVVISRTKTKVEEVKSAIEEKHGVEVKAVVCDYSNFDKAARTRISKELQGLDIGVLVNNVGVSYPFPQFFHELDDDAVANLIEININSTTWMTRIVLPGMIERKRGCIVNVSRRRWWCSSAV